jgi:hypothetical protein
VPVGCASSVRQLTEDSWVLRAVAGNYLPHFHTDSDAHGMEKRLRAAREIAAREGQDHPAAWSEAILFNYWTVIGSYNDTVPLDTVLGVTVCGLPASLKSSSAFVQDIRDSTDRFAEAKPEQEGQEWPIFMHRRQGDNDANVRR